MGTKIPVLKKSLILVQAPNNSDFNLPPPMIYRALLGFPKYVLFCDDGAGDEIIAIRGDRNHDSDLMTEATKPRMG